MPRPLLPRQVIAAKCACRTSRGPRESTPLIRQYKLQADCRADRRPRRPRLAWLHHTGGGRRLSACHGARGFRVGLSLFVPAWSEPALLKLAYAFEQTTMRGGSLPSRPPSTRRACKQRPPLWMALITSRSDTTLTDHSEVSRGATCWHHRPVVTGALIGHSGGCWAIPRYPRRLSAFPRTPNVVRLASLRLGLTAARNTSLTILLHSRSALLCFLPPHSPSRT